jgi:TonB-dependent SusC/RagA subfamily outer membrane receptor
MLKEVEIKEKKENSILEMALQNSITRGQTSDQVLTFIDLAHSPTLQTALRSKVTGLRIIPDIKSGAFSVGYEDGGGVIVINGTTYPDLNELAGITPNLIAGIEIIKGGRAAIYKNPRSPLIPTVALLITLKTGEVDYQKYIDEYDENTHMANNKAKMLKQEVSKTNKQKKIMELALQNSQSPAKGADQTLTFLDLTGCTNLAECLGNKLAGIRVAPQPDGSFNAFYNNTKMGILVNGKITPMPVIDPAQIAAIEVVKGPRAAMFLPTTTDTTNNYKGGLLIITSKKDGVNYKKYVDEQEEEKLANSSKSVLLNEIVIKAKKNAATIMDMSVKNSSNLAGAGHADQVLTFIDLLPCGGNFMQCLSGRLTNIIISGGKAYSRGFDSPMYVIIDGVGDRDPGALSTIEVSSVEVLRGGGAASLYGVKGANGVLIITTKKGDVDYSAYEIEHYRPRDSNKPKAFVKYNFQGGYDFRREFYSPDYSNPATDKQIADLRTTIYWKPNVITDGNGRASVEFYNADSTGNYRVVAEGLDKDGNLGRQVFKYTVK